MNQLKPCTSLEARNTICISVIWGGRVGWGGGNNVHVKWHTHGNVCCAVRVGIGGVGWGNNVHINLNTHGLGSSFALAHTRHATLWDLLLDLHTHVMLRSGIFFCTCAHTSCYAPIFVGISLSLLLICPPHVFLGVCLSSSKFPFPVFLVFLPGFARALSL